MTFHANEVCSKINAAEEKLQETVTTDVSRWAQLVSHKSPRSKSAAVGVYRLHGSAYRLNLISKG